MSGSIERSKILLAQIKERINAADQISDAYWPDKINAIIDAQRGLADVLLYLLKSAVETPPHQSKEKS